MSIDILNIAWCVQCESHTEKVILLLLADCANGEEADGIFPSLEYVMANCNLSRRGVQNNIERMKSKQWLELVTPANQKKISDQKTRYRRTNEYRFNVDRLLRSVDPVIARKRKVAVPSTGAPGAPVSDTEQVHAVHGYRCTRCTQSLLFGSLMGVLFHPQLSQRFRCGHLFSKNTGKTTLFRFEFDIAGDPVNPTTDPERPDCVTVIEYATPDYTQIDDSGLYTRPRPRHSQAAARALSRPAAGRSSMTGREPNKFHIDNAAPIEAAANTGSPRRRWWRTSRYTHTWLSG